MSLVVWLPLNRDLRNQGVRNIAPSFTNDNSSIVTNGKLGSCLKTMSSRIDTTFNIDVNTSSLSFGGWFNFNKEEIQTIIDTKTYTETSKASSGNIIGNSSYGGVGLVFTTNNLYDNEKVLSNIKMFATLRTQTVNQSTKTYNIVFDDWVHLFVVWDKDTLTLSFYVNGTLYDSKTYTSFSDATTRNFYINYDAVYDGNYISLAMPFKSNDIRFYNHALSVSEVKELSKALVCHYKLDNRNEADNLIVNGYGELGSENWNDANKISTTEIPPDHSEIKASFYNGAITTEYIPIISSHTYTISGYIKAMEGKTTGTTYPSIYPYDADLKFINCFNSREGFNTSTATTLRQELKTGDTVIYATDLSAWSTADNYYNYCAIFGYKNSYGYVYDDLVYTQDCPVFAKKGSTKTNIDKTNNTITLNAPYTGEDRPVGTTICQSTAGGTYYYPWSGIAVSSIQDWVFKTKTFTPISINRLLACEYIKWSTYGSCHIAGNKLIDETDTTTIICDSSGYGYHGTKVNSLAVSLDSPRYSKSTYFNGVDCCITVPFNTIIPSGENFTVSQWFKKDQLGSKSYETLFGGGNFESDTRAGAASTLSWYMATVRGGKVYNSFDFGKWYMLTIVNDGTNELYYVNGELVKTIEKKAMPTGTYTIGSWKTNTSQNYEGRMSDFRIYATPLSADDVKELYQVSAKIDDHGNMYGYEINENITTRARITKQGIINASKPSTAFIEDSGSSVLDNQFVATQFEEI